MWNVQDKTGMTVASMDPMVRLGKRKGPWRVLHRQCCGALPQNLA